MKQAAPLQAAACRILERALSAQYPDREFQVRPGQVAVRVRRTG